MIDPSIINLEKLIEVLLNNHSVQWRKHAEIIPNYQAGFGYHQGKEIIRSICVVRIPSFLENEVLKYSYLRHSCGPHQGFFWDVYGDDLHSPEYALLALHQAPIPHSLLSEKFWQANAALGKTND